MLFMNLPWNTEKSYTPGLGKLYYKEKIDESKTRKQKKLIVEEKL